jgi:hypothetical protein
VLWRLCRAPLTDRNGTQEHALSLKAEGQPNKKLVGFRHKAKALFEALVIRMGLELKRGTTSPIRAEGQHNKQLTLPLGTGRSILVGAKAIRDTTDGLNHRLTWES